MFQSSVAEGTEDILSAFGEMSPSFEVRWDDDCVIECLRGFDSFLRSQRQMEWTDFRNACSTDVQDRGLDRKTASDFRDAFIPDSIARNVNALFG